MKLVCAGLILLAFTVLSPCASFADVRAEESAIRSILNDTFDRPESRLWVGPVVVEEAYAIADRTPGDMGGRGLLRRTDATWRLILCSGDELKSPDLLERAGMPERLASKLVTKLAAAEEKLDKARLAQLSRFDGVMYMDAGTTHENQMK